MFTVDCSPGVLSDSRSFRSFFQDEITSDDGERNFIFVDLAELVFLVVVTIGKFVEFHLFIGDVLHDRFLE